MKTDVLTLTYHVLCIGTILNFAVIFLTAYFSDNYTTYIRFNHYGEANAELFILVVLLVLMIRFSLIYFYNFFKQLFN